MYCSSSVQSNLGSSFIGNGSCRKDYREWLVFTKKDQQAEIGATPYWVVIVDQDNQGSNLSGSNLRVNEGDEGK